MREVAIIGIGQTKVEEQWDKSLRELAGDAALAAFEDSGQTSVDAIYVGNMMSGSANSQLHLGTYIADWVGMRYREAAHIEAACSSAAAAFRSAVLAVASGDVNCALAVGVEKMTDSPSGEITAQLATAADADYELDMGVSFVALNALIMKRYMHEFGWQHEHFAPFSINAHANGVNNPNARFQSPITKETYLRAPVVAEPINIMDASPMGDGAAAAMVVSLDFARYLGVKSVQVVGSAAATDSIAIHHREDPLTLSAAVTSARQAYSQAGITPADIDFFELHDAFTIMSALSLEAAGFAERGKGPTMALDGDITLTGKLPVSTLGGLKARGHPVGATGLYQIVEAVLQMRGQAGKSQLERTRYGMTQNIGGSGSNIITHIFKSL